MLTPFLGCFRRTWAGVVMELVFSQLRTTPASSPELVLSCLILSPPRSPLLPSGCLCLALGTGRRPAWPERTVFLSGLQWPPHWGVTAPEAARHVGHLAASVSSSGQHRNSSLRVGRILSRDLSFPFLWLAYEDGYRMFQPHPFPQWVFDS